jgi:hypothetical protein
MWISGIMINILNLVIIFLINLFFLIRRSGNNFTNLCGEKERKKRKHEFFGYSPNDLLKISITIYEEEIELMRDYFKTIVGENFQKQYDAMQFLITCKIPSHLPEYAEKYEIKPSKYFAKDPDSKQYNIPIGLGLFAKKDLSDPDLGIVNFIYYFL